MAIPANRLSTTLQSAAYTPPDDLQNSNLTDYEWGGIGLNDPSAGLRYQFWTLQYTGGSVRISSPNTALTTLFTLANITEISLAFDQNMNPFVAYVQSGVSKFYWWDTDIAMFAHGSLPAGCTSPRCCLDDKRSTQNASSDIILAYLRAGSLRFRMQRDRYEVEYTLTAIAVGLRLIKVGMNSINRLQFQLSFNPS